MKIILALLLFTGCASLINAPQSVDPNQYTGTWSSYYQSEKVADWTCTIVFTELDSVLRGSIYNTTTNRDTLTLNGVLIPSDSGWITYKTTAVYNGQTDQASESSVMLHGNTFDFGINSVAGYSQSIHATK